MLEEAPTSSLFLSAMKVRKVWWWGGVACLIIVSLQVLSFENLTLNFEFRVQTLTWTLDWTLTWTLDLDLDTGPDLELDNLKCRLL